MPAAELDRCLAATRMKRRNTESCKARGTELISRWVTEALEFAADRVGLRTVKVAGACKGTSKTHKHKEASTGRGHIGEDSVLALQQPGGVNGGPNFLSVGRRQHRER